jgi:hypothetical protein
MIVLCVAGVLLLALGIAVLLLVKPLIRRVAEEEARQHGVALQVSDVEIGLGRLSFANATFTLVGVHGLTGKIGSLDIELRGLSPERIRATGLELAVIGSFPTVALELGAWTKDHPQIYRLPMIVRGASISWRASPEVDPWLTLEDGTLDPTHDGATFVAERAHVAGIAVGKLGARCTTDESVILLGFGTTDLATAPISVRVQHAIPEPTLLIMLAPTPVERLAPAFGVAVPVRGVVTSGQAELRFPAASTDGGASGNLAIKLQGFIPPHPRELDGFVFGNVTAFESNLKLDPTFTRATLSGTKVTAGAFSLSGDGSVERLPDHARVLLRLRGALPCGALAGAALETHLGKTIGAIMKRATREFLRGSVGVTVNIDASTRDLGAAKLERTIGVGCGLAPLRWPTELRDLPKLNLPALPSNLPPLPSALPPLPSAFPKFPPFPLPRAAP